MYDKLHPSRTRIKPKFYEGAEEFILVAYQSQQFINEGKGRCPYGKCSCRKYLNFEIIRYHLYKGGFMLDYWI